MRIKDLTKKMKVVTIRGMGKRRNTLSSQATEEHWTLFEASLDLAITRCIEFLNQSPSKAKEEADDVDLEEDEKNLEGQQEDDENDEADEEGDDDESD